MDFILISTAAAAPTMMLVAMYKMARPSAASWSVVLCALLCGEFSCFLFALMQRIPFDGPNVAATIIAGIFAAATAAGVRSADNASDAKREEVKS